MTIRCHIIDETSLCIDKGKAVLVIYVEIHSLTYDGNMLDAAIIACMTALRTTNLPHLEYNEKTGIVRHIPTPPSEQKKIKMNNVIFPITFGLLENDIILADPNLNEESIIEGTITIVYNSQGSISGIFKMGGSSLNQEHLDHILNEAYNQFNKLYTLLLVND
jgi:exosome complex RNA-binding protein Rrp42 (RNase PH superfamily)